MGAPISLWALVATEGFHKKWFAPGFWDPFFRQLLFLGGGERRKTCNRAQEHVRSLSFPLSSKLISVATIAATG